MSGGGASRHLGLVPLIIVSPHLDDAVWSCFNLLRGATVVTICAGIPAEDEPPTQFDVRAGFRSAADAMRARRLEDKEAARLAGFRVRHLDHMLCNYAPMDADLAVAEALDGIEDEIVVGPLGLRHPDHVGIANAFCRFVQTRPLEAWLYEELPYAYVWPADLAPALTRAGVNGDTVTRLSPPEKALAVNAYVSQTKGAHMDAILAPERYHPVGGIL